MGVSASAIRLTTSFAFPFTKTTTARSSIFYSYRQQLTKTPKLKVNPFVKYSNLLPKTVVSYPTELEVLKPLSQIYLNQTKVSGLTISPKNDGLSTVNLNVTSKKDTILLKIVYTRGNIPQQHKINVYGIGEDKPLLAVMNLESSFQHKGCILCVKSPPEHVIGYVYELPGISSVAIIQNEKQETILQILMNGEFGWSNSAKILSAKGDRKLGRMYKRKEGPTTTRNALHTVIHLPTDLPVPTKLILIGTCLNLMGRSQI